MCLKWINNGWIWLIRKYLVPISSLESQYLSNDAAVFKPKINLDYVVSTDTIVENSF